MKIHIIADTYLIDERTRLVEVAAAWIKCGWKVCKQETDRIVLEGN